MGEAKLDHADLASVIEATVKLIPLEDVQRIVGSPGRLPDHERVRIRDGFARAASLVSGRLPTFPGVDADAADVKTLERVYAGMVQINHSDHGPYDRRTRMMAMVQNMLTEARARPLTRGDSEAGLVAGEASNVVPRRTTGRDTHAIATALYEAIGYTDATFDERHAYAIATARDIIGKDSHAEKRASAEPEPDGRPCPIPIRLPCPSCGELHIDEGEFATKVHHTHSCQHCGMTWRPAVVETVGVRFLPGFKNETDEIDRSHEVASAAERTYREGGPAAAAFGRFAEELRKAER